MVRYFLVLPLLIGLTGHLPLHAQDTLTVETAVRTALENNFSILIAGNEAEIAENNNSPGNAGFFPSVTATGTRSQRVEDSRSEFRGGIPPNNTEGAKTTGTNASVALNWTIFDGFRMFTTYDKLADMQERGEQQYRLAVENNIRQVIETYFDIVRREKSYQVLQSTLEISEQRIQIAETKLDLGSGSRYDLLQAKADYNADRAALLRQEVQLSNAKIRLNEQMGKTRPREVSYEVSTDIPVRKQMGFDDILREALNENISLALARTSLRIAELELKEIQRERYPELDVYAGYGYSKTESGAGFLQLNQSDGFNYGITARINLFDGFTVNRRIQNSRISLKNRELAMEEQKVQLESEVSRTYADYANALRLIGLEEENLEIARQTLDIALERFKLGTINSIELREAQRTLIDAENRLIQARFEAKTAETALLQVSGRLMRPGNFPR